MPCKLRKMTVHSSEGRDLVVTVCDTHGADVGDVLNNRITWKKFKSRQAQCELGKR